jgi:DNA helicase HerA-like ATPase
VKRAEVVGNIFSRSTYGIDKILITLRQGRKLPLGSYVFVLDDDGLPIIYQITSPEYYRYGYDFEKRLIAYGRAVKDDSYTYDCTGILVGKLYEDGRIEPPRYPVPPLADVYLCTPELVKMITEPDEEPKVRIGINVLTKEPVYIKLRPLIRQGLLISGAQGTGKTTALLTLITRSLEAFDKLRFLILDWTGEFDALVNSEYAKRFRITSITWDEFVASSKIENLELLLKLIISEDPRVQGAVYEVISSALAMCKKEGVYPTKDNLRRRISEQLQYRKPETIQTALSVIERSTHIPRSPPKTIWTRQHFIEEIEKNNVVIIDFTKTNDPQTPDDMEVKMQVATSLANYIWEEATCRKDFGCIIVSDEAHRIAPEKAYSGIYGEREKINPIWIRLATEGGRKGCPLWFAARRLSLVSKAITTELQQNFICFNVEDVDRERVKQDIGETFASLLGALSPGEAIVKSATGFKIPGQVIHVKFDLVLQPSSVKYGLEERFKPLSPTTPTLPPSPNPTPELEPVTDKVREPETQPKD